MLSCLARTATVEDARNFCAEFTQEEAFLVSVPVLTFILVFFCFFVFNFVFYVGGRGLPGGNMQGEKKSNFDLKQYIYIYFPLIIIREINFL